MQLYNTLTHKVEEFNPLNPPAVTFYSCGPTVYDFTHIGHARTYVNTDVLKRTLLYLGYQINHVMNITDVGHLTGDDDTGEDKLEKGAKLMGKSVWDVAQFYTAFFQKTIQKLNIIPPDHLVRATDHIKQMIELIKVLMDKGFAYETDEAVYFDVSKFENYGKLSGQKLEEKLKGARKEVYVDPKKKNPVDFALWFKCVGRFKDHQMHWESPWGKGFPGWHIECSALSMQYLGETIDIHGGGVDHIPTHHENEIAQSEAATGKPFVRVWFHNEFLLVEGQKMSKSLKNFYTIDDVEQKGIEPLALRLFFLQTHYRKQLNFTWQAAKAAQEGYNKLKDYVLALRSQTQRSDLSDEKLKQIENYSGKFKTAISTDLQIPQAVAVMWEMLKSNIPSSDKFDVLLDFDKVLGLKLSEVEGPSKRVLELAVQHFEAKKIGDFKKSDQIRQQIDQLGYQTVESSSGTAVVEKRQS